MCTTVDHDELRRDPVLFAIETKDPYEWDFGRGRILEMAKCRNCLSDLCNPRCRQRGVGEKSNA